MDKLDIKLELDLEGKNADEQTKIINGNLKAIGDGLKTYHEGLEVEMSKNSKNQEETKQHVDQLLLTQTEMKALLDSVKQELANVPKAGDERQPRTFGELFLNQEGVKETLAGMESGGHKASLSHTVNAALTNDSLGIAEPDRVAGIAEIGRQRLRIRDLFRKGRTGSNAVEFYRQTTRTNNADAVSENPSAGKPESDMGGAIVSSPVATIAHFMKASKQVLSDTAMLQSFIDGELRYGLGVKEEQQILYGTGSGVEMNGVHTQATTYSEPTGADVTAETRVDRLRLAILQAEQANYYADGIVLSLLDWCNIELTKDSQNNYVLANPFGMLTPTLWGRPVADSASVEDDDFLVGAFGTAATLWERELTSVSIAFENQDDFIKNMVTILAELRETLTVSQAGAFIKGDFQGLPS
jgi:HK97 family phage major capsid protein